VFQVFQSQINNIWHLIMFTLIIAFTEFLHMSYNTSSN